MISTELIQATVRQRYPDAVVAEYQYPDRDAKMWVIMPRIASDPDLKCTLGMSGLELRRCQTKEHIIELLSSRLRIAYSSIENALTKTKDPLADIIQAVGKNRQTNEWLEKKSEPGLSERVVMTLRERREQLKQNIIGSL